MEENNYRDEFELFLKGSVDEFKMVPSRKVWYSLYNNLHPDRRWPSMAVCLLILTAVLYLGIANNNSLSSAARKASAENFTSLLNDKHIDNKITFSANDYIKPSKKIKQKFSLIADQGLVPIFVENVVSSNTEALSQVSKELVAPINESQKSIQTEPLSTAYNATNISYVTESFETIKDVVNDLSVTESLKEVQQNNIELGIISKGINNNITPPENNILKTELLNVEKSWKEDYAFRNKPAINKFKQNTTLNYYITPSVGYRNFSKKSASSSTNSYSTTNRTINDPTQLLDNAALNLEAGVVLQYSVSGKLKFKTGMQANYTNHISNVTAIGHPSQTSITLNNTSNLLRSSNFTTNAGKDRINKTTMQIALPIGADYKIAGDEKVKWYVGGTIQPTYVLNGSAFVLSTDEKYYISETALLRKMNLNTSIETFISFKSSKGIILNVGPQFRYQLLSTYKKAYNYTERVYNIGLKIGVTRSF